MPCDQPHARDLALIGVGSWGRNLARCFDTLGALGWLVTNADNHDELCELRGRHPEARIATCLADVLRDARVTKVAIAAPAAAHFELAKQALEADKDVFVEKPLCLRLDQARALKSMAEARGKQLMVGHLLQYHPCVVELRNLVAKGSLGRLLTITCSRLNLGKFRTDENALWSFAPHDISLVLALLDDQLPDSVRCMGGSFLSPKVADTTLTFLRFRNEVLAQLHVSWLSPFKEQRLTVVGTEGMAVFDDTKPWSEKLLLYRGYLGPPEAPKPAPSLSRGEPVPVAEAEPLLAECAHFLDVCRTRHRPRTDGAEGVRVLTVLELAQRSLERDGELVQLADLPAPPLSEQDSASAPAFFVHPSAVVDTGAEIGSGTKIWHFSHIMPNARLGQRCSLGQNVHVASGVIIGNDVKVQNNVSIYRGAQLEDGVFLGPACVFTNVRTPRSEVDRSAHYDRTLVRRGATIGANATIVCGISIGRYAFIAAGAVLVKDVPDYALMLGNPARQQGYVSRHGCRLEPGPDGVMVCPESGLRYREIEPGCLKCLDLDEDAPLPEALRSFARAHDEPKD